MFNLARRAKRDGTPAEWIQNLLAYWKTHSDNPSGVYHPTHRTEDEKRLIRNAKARQRRAKAKE